MPVSVRDLLEMPSLDLRLVAGKTGVDHAIRWAHTSELEDPTEWLSGGEFLLTTGIGIGADPEAQRSYLQRLIDAGLAGLGFGVGLGYESVPEAVRELADRAGFAVVEVPYPTPFIAITEAVSSRLAQDRLRDAQMSVEVHERLAALVTNGAGATEVLEQIVELAPGWALLFDSRGTVSGEACSPGMAPPNPSTIWSGLPVGILGRHGPATAGQTGPEGTSVAVVVKAGGSPRPQGVLVFGKRGRIEQSDRIVVHHAVTVLGLLLSSRRAVIETERRVAGDVLSEAFEGRVSGDELVRRLQLVGFDPEAELAVLVVDQDDGLALDDLAWVVDAAASARAPAARVGITEGRVAALVHHQAPESLAEVIAADVREVLEEDGSSRPIRIGVGDGVPATSIRDSYIGALFALKAAPADKAVASPRDLGSYGFLLGAQPRAALEGFVRSVLGPLIDRDESKSSELVESIRAFIEAAGRWEQGAETLGVHRHTLRYRVRQAEELLGRDLTEAEDRLEIWLALKALEILRA